MKKEVFLLSLLLLINGCKQSNPVECTTSSDCSTSGCSGQICAPLEESKDIITTCEFKEQYKCFELTSCSCIDNKCQWEENKGFLDCKNEVNA